MNEDQAEEERIAAKRFEAAVRKAAGNWSHHSSVGVSVIVGRDLATCRNFVPPFGKRSHRRGWSSVAG